MRVERNNDLSNARLWGSLSSLLVAFHQATFVVANTGHLFFQILGIANVLFWGTIGIRLGYLLWRDRGDQVMRMVLEEEDLDRILNHANTTIEQRELKSEGLALVTTDNKEDYDGYL